MNPLRRSSTAARSRVAARKFACLVEAGFLGVMLTGCTGCTPEENVTEGREIIEPTGSKAPYTVQSGDTLYTIAGSHGVNWRDIVTANPNVDWQALRAGQVILIPGGRMPTPGPGPGPGPITPPPPATMNPGHPGPIPAEGHFVWPLRGDILARFHQAVPWRMNEANQGVDIAARPGAVVVAAKSGRVNTFTRAGDDGKLVILEHQDRTATCYGHLDEILAKHGTWVKQGEAIGSAGASGRARGTELSFRIMQNDHFVDPLPLLSR